MNTFNTIKLKATADSGHQLQWNYSEKWQTEFYEISFS